MSTFSISKFNGVIVLLVMGGALVHSNAYSSQKEAMLPKGPVSLDRDIKVGQAAVITFTTMPPDKPLPNPTKIRTSSLVMNGIDVEKKRWKELFAVGRSHWGGKNPAEVLEKLVAAQCAHAKPDGVFMKKAVKTLVPFVKGMELHDFQGCSEKIKIQRIDPCSCCALGRYHLELVNQPNVMRSGLIEKTPASDVFYSKIFATKKIIPDKFSKWLFTKPMQVSDELTIKNALRRSIMCLFHEITHLARLDSVKIAFFLEDALQEKNARHVMELQADSIPLLLLQNDDYFIASAEHFSGLILINEQECLLLRSQYYPHHVRYAEAVCKEACSKASKDDRQALIELYELYLTDPKEGTRLFLDKASSVLCSKTHPYGHVRLSHVLNMWAAYLIYEKPAEFGRDEAIDYVHDLMNSIVYCWNVPDCYADRKKLLRLVIDDWSNKAKSSSALSGSSASSSTVTPSSSKKKRKYPDSSS